MLELISANARQIMEMTYVSDLGDLEVYDRSGFPLFPPLQVVIESQLRWHGQMGQLLLPVQRSSRVPLETPMMQKQTREVPTFNGLYFIHWSFLFFSSRTVSWSECSFSACCRAGGWLCMSQIWRDPGTVVQLWPELTDSPAVICHPKAEKHSSYYGKTVMCFKNVERTRHPGNNLQLWSSTF